ncbi:MAG: hypothetical protein MI924_38400 [Chloroflexales bacterium]|nr:hypothetical protein [Chloroflexales bacterium]
MKKYGLYVITVISWIVALVWVVIEPGFEPLLAFLAGCGALLTTFVMPKERDGAAQQPSLPDSFTDSGANAGQQADVNSGTMTQHNQTITNSAPNQGAQGVFHGPVRVTEGSVDARNADFSGAQGVTISGVTITHKPAHNPPAEDDDRA